MGRLIEFVITAFIFLLLFRRLVYPFLRGYMEVKARMNTNPGAPPRPQSNTPPPSPPESKPRVDRSHVQDADFKDL